MCVSACVRAGGVSYCKLHNINLILLIIIINKYINNENIKQIKQGDFRRHGASGSVTWVMGSRSLGGQHPCHLKMLDQRNTCIKYEQCIWCR